MRILVTGGSGFLGARLISKLKADEYDVLALARSPSSVERVRSLGATPVSSDLETLEAGQLPDLDGVIHTAAYFRFAGPRRPYFRVNTDGTKRLLEVAKRAGAKTFVHVSAAGIIMDDKGSKIRNADESAPTFPDSFSGYIASKARAEAAVLAADHAEFRTIAIRPPGIWGPGDAFSKAIPEAIGSGQFRFIDRGDYPVATCHVDNVIEALQCALVGGQGGRAYFITDPEPTTFRDFVAMLASVHGLSIEKIGSMSYRLAFTLGRIMEAGAAVTLSKKDPPLSRTLVRMIGREFTLDDAAARHSLSYAARTSRSQGLAAFDETAVA
ncbi:NAD-dependent epimerase/dehydratase family protein [Salinisphaera aquimarina]|uniref:NAD-dependent epimerase/dehydratase family protein n=1 Tax=Salinisphaera aquimarina TaxID=2094031 RepID=A0ABV7EMQ1_9GAMM